MCPRSTSETDGIAAKLVRWGIAREALRRNLPLSRQNRQCSGGVCFHACSSRDTEWDETAKSVKSSRYTTLETTPQGKIGLRFSFNKWQKGRQRTRPTVRDKIMTRTFHSFWNEFPKITLTLTLCIWSSQTQSL